ncbi:DUF6238 family protein [Kitasatospora sp. NRRL B-11411]|uniref:DUF6238 family protein n=1 Tax=Kitasatospora sp. NRRL B-11411 TaxID=1463822 RepID=UPI0004C43203|nr:DUF6238 family protein [Kitasatospora sp. NRRL B-11411]
MPATSPDFVPYATAAVDFHRVLNVPAGPLVASRTELDCLHEHLTSLHALLDAHAERTAPLLPAEGNHLRAARTRLWQAADHLHAAYHSAPRPGSGEVPDAEACRARLPEGAPELTVCRRHQQAARLVRRRTTPTDLHSSFTGLVRH